MLAWQVTNSQKKSCSADTQRPVEPSHSKLRFGLARLSTLSSADMSPHPRFPATPQPQLNYTPRSQHGLRVFSQHAGFPAVICCCMKQISTGIHFTYKLCYDKIFYGECRVSIILFLLTPSLHSLKAQAQNSYHKPRLQLIPLTRSPVQTS